MPVTVEQRLRAVDHHRVDLRAADDAGPVLPVRVSELRYHRIRLGAAMIAGRGLR
jgi:hypothetical protein